MVQFDSVSVLVFTWISMTIDFVFNSVDLKKTNNNNGKHTDIILNIHHKKNKID